MARPDLPAELWGLVAAEGNTAAMAGVSQGLRAAWLGTNRWSGTVFEAMLARRRGVPAAIDLHDLLTANFKVRDKRGTVPTHVAISEACANHRDFAALRAKLGLGAAGGRIKSWRDKLMVVSTNARTRSRPRSVPWPGFGPGAWTTLAADLARVIGGEAGSLPQITVKANRRIQVGGWRAHARVVVYRSTLGDSAVGWELRDSESSEGRPGRLPKTFVWLCAGHTDGRDIVLTHRNQEHPHAALIESPMRASRTDAFLWATHPINVTLQPWPSPPT